MAIRRLADAARQVLRTWHPQRDSDGDGVLGELTSALRDLDACDVDEPVGTTADEMVAEAGIIVAEQAAIRDAFAAGAEYMRRSAHLRLDSTGRYQVMTLPDAERVAAAVSGYVEGLGR